MHIYNKKLNNLAKKNSVKIPRMHLFTNIRKYKKKLYIKFCVVWIEFGFDELCLVIL